MPRNRVTDLKIIRESRQITNHPISKYVEKCSKYGFTFVFFEEYEEFLPKGCTEIIRLSDQPGKGAVLNSANGDELFGFESERISDQSAEYAAVKMGAVIVPEVSLESQLTRSITMYEMLDILSADDLDLGKRWEQAQVYKSMAAPLGVKANDEIVYLDISDKGSAHGPHGLVAGTTGSGKSEILQTYVLSMATLFHPHEVGFVIIDFKGGGMANQFKDLPHLMGTITNIDGREITRSLLSTKAELVKRQTLFAAAGVNHINDYIKLYKKGEVTQPLPHLIMIVDEFAELKAEYPDFMKEIISAARIGRTLGIHLILATQKPAGVVDNQIWSNSKFKLCLKVQTKEDSNEVIKTPLAAEIKEPGRAYFQVGNNEVFELFQSAFSGAKVTEGSSERPVELYELNKWGKRKLVYTNKTSQTREDAPTELEEIVEHVHNYCAAHGIARLPGICLPPLPDTLRADRLSRFEKDICKGIIIPIGMYDDPENQIQGNYEVNFTASNDKIIAKDKMNAYAKIRKTHMFIAMDKYPEALKSSESLMETSPDLAVPYQLKFAILCDMGRFDEAEKVLDRASEMFPGDVQFDFDRATLYGVKGENDKAIEMLGKIELTEYNEAAILVKKARLLLSDLKVDEAIAVLEPLYVKTQDAEAAFLLSTVYMAKKDYDKAKSYAQELIDKNEFDDFYYSAVYTRAAALVRSGDPESVSALREANKIFRAACARNPGYVQYYLYRAVCHKELREFNEAIEMLDYIITVAHVMQQADELRGLIQTKRLCRTRTEAADGLAVRAQRLRQPILCPNVSDHGTRLLIL